MPHVLFLGGGRRVELARHFEAEGCTVSLYELSPNVPLGSNHKVIVGERWDSPIFERHLADVCHANEVDLVVPLDCHGVVALAAAKNNLGAAIAAVPTVKAANASHDKLIFETALVDGRRPEDCMLYPRPVLGLPAIIKPRFGNGSKGVRRTAKLHRSDVGPDEVSQYELVGREYSVDCWFNLRGDLVGASPRERLRVAGGEVIESITVDNPQLVIGSIEVGKKLGLTGPACIQFKEDDYGRPCVLECNARFGGGSTLSIAAGLPMAKYCLRQYLEDEDITPENLPLKTGLFMSRSYRDHFFLNGGTPFETNRH